MEKNKTFWDQDMHFFLQCTPTDADDHSSGSKQCTPASFLAASPPRLRSSLPQAPSPGHGCSQGAERSSSPPRSNQYFRVPQPSPTCLRRGRLRPGPPARPEGSGSLRTERQDGQQPQRRPPRPSRGPVPTAPRGTDTGSQRVAAPLAAGATGRGTAAARAAGGEGPRREGLADTPTPSLVAPHLF